VVEVLGTLGLFGALVCVVALVPTYFMQGKGEAQHGIRCVAGHRSIGLTPVINGGTTIRIFFHD
jgi:hypothetical protein